VLPYLAATLIHLVLAAMAAVLAWYGVSALRIVARTEGTSALTSSENLVFWGATLFGVAAAALCFVRLRTIYRRWQTHNSKEALPSNSSDIRRSY
jgi:TRAP-type C4-dicarboxylate transport system permease small subunit